MTTSDGPTPLSVSLDALAQRIRRVDLRSVEHVRSIWRERVEPPLSTRCRPEVVKDGVLIVTVPSNAFAARIAADRDRILASFGDLGAGSPRAIRTVIAAPDDPLRAAGGDGGGIA